MVEFRGMILGIAIESFVLAGMLQLKIIEVNAGQQLIFGLCMLLVVACLHNAIERRKLFKKE